MSEVTLHPLVDGGIKHGSERFDGGVLVCLCPEDPVMVRVSSPIAHSHLCGCSQCWKPAGAVFAVTAIVPADKVGVLENDDKLHVVDSEALIQRHACKACGVHLYGPVKRPGHPFTGLAFIHPERFAEHGAPAPTFAAYVSSIIESGARPDRMGAVRARLRELGLAPYDCLNPPLMDYVATFNAKAKGVLSI
jgi:S-(hydroxymethyl)glutathione synthase